LNNELVIWLGFYTMECEVAFSRKYITVSLQHVPENVRLQKKRVELWFFVSVFL
jgi:hypothetical protein